MAASLFAVKPIEGYLLAAGNLVEAGSWCGGVVDAVAGTITLDLEDGLFSASIGEYVTKDLDGFFHVWTPEEFVTYYGQVAAIGLDAKTDAQKITDIIAALRAHGLIGPNA